MEELRAGNEKMLSSLEEKLVACGHVGACGREKLSEMTLR